MYVQHEFSHTVHTLHDRAGTFASALHIFEQHEKIFYMRRVDKLISFGMLGFYYKLVHTVVYLS